MTDKNVFVHKDALLQENSHEFYHAHVYFDETTLPLATQLCQQAANLFNLKLGRIHQKLVGPHPKWSCQLAFTQVEYDELLHWLNKNRQGLSILIHADTGKDFQDHTEYASWLGVPLVLNLAVFR
ncbi:DOPA 4,5-dioxygenase family protein [uncultured Shewanella sp.]|uniref:DOPA 4,5-dioxygenase family protein n=1 Tax=uncultured Shewanella sp. TaxID=173975 RepID=UPI00260EBF51|nr:DOPA 4,5-dioxygenase family protein [uncultured Shewanella sp.]